MTGDIAQTVGRRGQKLGYFTTSPYPRCIGGEGACPPEDCGGPPGYEHLRKILANPDDEEHGEMVTWMGLEHACEFDPAAFDIEAVNRRLVAVGSPR